MQPTRQANLTSIRRDAWIEVDLNNLEHNVRALRQNLYKGKRPQLMAVVKSDAYGHGSIPLSQLFAATEVDYLGVASIDEGTQIRDAGVTLPILILSPTPTWAISAALENNLEITVSTEKQLQDLSQKARSTGKKAAIHLKVDTGMHRLGVPIDRLPIILQTIAADSGLRLVSVYSHLANASVEASVLEQKELFERAVALTRPLFPEAIFHLASSEATTRFPDCHYDMVRVGLYLYGLEPNTVSETLLPAMSVKARINHTNTIAAGEKVGYGHTWTSRRETRLAAIPVGYADGVDRGLSNQMKGLLLGRVIDQVGRISMDQMLFDITDVPEAGEGDIITLIGQEGDQTLYLSDWAVCLDTITYELACRMRARLPRMYTRNKSRKPNRET
ncbi:MAG: alanine racemase [Cyanobacteria bacterium SZAS LIN-2]|nr:alanine racemase [Cyanobacteria bacterium SZAS LIN-2]